MTHIDIGERLSPLREDGVLIVGSGSSFHNFAAFVAPAGSKERKAGVSASQVFDSWLRSTLTDLSTDYAAKRGRLLAWRDDEDDANRSRACHPEGGDEHFTPMFVAFGAGKGASAKAVGDLTPQECALEAKGIMGDIKMSNIQWG